MLKFNEDTRVKIPATIQFLKIGYNYQSLKDENLDIDFNTKIFINRFKPAIERINGKELTYNEIKSLLDEINGLIKNNDLGKETAKMCDQVLKGKKPANMPVKIFKTNLNIYVNQKTLKTLGLKLPASITSNKKYIKVD